ncbi:MAG: hypothetical protein J6E40_09965 [Lachnospiraceae bacterium]|nr:hypothetical protein [Lachnospiraceae bacterium]
MNFTISIDEAHELLQGMRDATAELILLRFRKDSLQASVAAANSENLKLEIWKPAEGYDYLAEVTAEIADIEADIMVMERIIEAGRQRVRRIIPHLDKDNREIVRLYYLFPVKDAAGNLRTWKEVEDLMKLSHTAVMKRRRKLFDDVNRIIDRIEEEGETNEPL